MASYEIVWKSSAERDLKSIDRQFIPQIIENIESLSKNPFPLKHRKLQRAEASYRLRVRDYRVIYQVDTDKKLVTVYHIRHRKEAYRK